MIGFELSSNSFAIWPVCSSWVLIDQVWAVERGRHIVGLSLSVGILAVHGMARGRTEVVRCLRRELRPLIWNHLVALATVWGHLVMPIRFLYLFTGSKLVVNENYLVLGLSDSEVVSLSIVC